MLVERDHESRDRKRCWIVATTRDGFVGVVDRGDAVLIAQRATAEAMKIMFLDKELTYKVLAKQLRINDRKLLDAAYDEEIKVMERRLEFKNEAFQAIIDETSKVDARAKKLKPQDFVDRRYLDGLQKSGFFDKLWSGK